MLIEGALQKVTNNMVRYVLAAQALRFFSISRATRVAYRAFGNSLGGRSRKSGIESHYLIRADHNLSRIEAYGGIANGMRVLELGTGWVHWESLFTALFYDVEIIAFDVWDCRQFEGLKAHANQLAQQLDKIDRPAEQIARAQYKLALISVAMKFEDIYRALNIRYLIHPEGRLDDIETGSIDLIYSSDVLEHVPAPAVQVLLADMNRVLKPGGMSTHWIVPADHLEIYDCSASKKEYLRWSDRTWRWLFENQVQHINRIQRSEWINAFRRADFSILHNEVIHSVPIDHINVAPRFRHLPKEDLECTVFELVARRSAHACACESAEKNKADRARGVLAPAKLCTLPSGQREAAS